MSVMANIDPAVTIIESGTQDGWRYKKYSDGTWEGIRKFSATVAVNIAQGNLYVCSTQTIPQPSGISVDHISLCITSSAASGILLQASNNYQIYRTVSTASATYSLSAEVKGTWT